MKSALLCLVMSGAACADQAAHIPEVTGVSVTETGAEAHRDALHCRDFKLTNIEASQFLAKAKVISSHELHYEYSWAPFYVRGTATVSGQPVRWEIRAGGTAKIIFPDGTETLLADKSQREKQE